MVDPIKGFAHVNEGTNDSCWFFQVQRTVDKMKELYQIMSDRETFNSMLIWINKFTYFFQQPIANEGLIQFRKIWGFRNDSQTVFIFRGAGFGNCKAILNLPMGWIDLIGGNEVEDF